MTQSDLDALETTVSNLTTTVGTKASQSDLDALQGTVNTTQSDLDALETTVSNLTTSVETKAAQSQVDHIESQLGLSFPATYGNIKDAVVDIAYVDRSDSSTYVGTGWFYLYDGKQYIVTAAHVGQDYDTTGTTSSRYSNRIYATILNHNDTGKNVTVPCLPIAADSRADIMVLVPYDGQARVTHHKALAFGRSRDVTPGTTCMIVGNARGYDVGSCSTGVIRDNAFVFPQGVETMFVAAPAVGGNSGGPIVDVSGNVIGSLTFGFANEETLGGGVAQFMMEPIVKKLIVQGETLLADFPQYVSAVEANTHSTYENRRLPSTEPPIGYRRRTFSSISWNARGQPVRAAARHDVLRRCLPSPIQSNDVVYEITYTPNDATFDPNYNGGKPCDDTDRGAPTVRRQRDVVHRRDQRVVCDRSHRAQQRDDDGIWSVMGLGHRLYAGKHRQVLAERASGETIVLSQNEFFFVARCTKEKKRWTSESDSLTCTIKDDALVKKGVFDWPNSLLECKAKGTDRAILQHLVEDHSELFRKHFRACSPQEPQRNSTFACR